MIHFHSSPPPSLRGLAPNPTINPNLSQPEPQILAPPIRKTAKSPLEHTPTTLNPKPQIRNFQHFSPLMPFIPVAIENLIRLVDHLRALGLRVYE